MNIKKVTAAVAKTPVKSPAVAAKVATKLAGVKPPDSVVPTQAPRKPKEKSAKKERKEKVIRDSFTMPQSEYQKIFKIKEACLKAGLPVKKSQVLRAGLKVLGEMNAAKLRQALAGLEKINTGRTKKC